MVIFPGLGVLSTPLRDSLAASAGFAKPD